MTVCFISSQLNWKYDTDVEVLPSNENGIKKTSLIQTSKIATIDKSLSIGKIGNLNYLNLVELNSKLKQILQL